MTVEVNGVLVAAHELKAPLAVMRQLALSLDVDVSPEVARTREQMVRVSEQAIRQVNDLAQISRLEDGMFELEPVAVRAVCDEVSREIGELFAAKNRRLAVRYSNRARLAVANFGLLKSVVYNFCTNALKYSEDGTVSKLVVRDRKGRIEISVRDYGPALPNTVWKEMKRGYVEQPMMVAQRPGSSGLGLYIASKFCKHMNAEVSAVRHRDGTSFTLLLPVSRQASLFEL